MAEFQRVPTVSALLVTPDGKVVVQLRDDKPGLPYPNRWATLGGGIKPGEEPGQGVGYLEDGTMVVIEGGREHVNQNVVANVTSVLQTSAGRMVFGKYESTVSA